jgi:hypothetical protein
MTDIRTVKTDIWKASLMVTPSIKRKKIKLR